MSICIPRLTYSYHLSRISTRFSAIALHPPCRCSVSFILPRYPVFLVGLFACAFPLFNSLFAVHIYLSIKGTLHDYRPFFGRHIFLLRMRASESSVMRDLRGSFKSICHFTKTLSQMIIEEFCRIEGKHVEISIINRQVLPFYIFPFNCSLIILE